MWNAVAGPRSQAPTPPTPTPLPPPPSSRRGLQSTSSLYEARAKRDFVSFRAAVLAASSHEQLTEALENRERERGREKPFLSLFSFCSNFSPTLPPPTCLFHEKDERARDAHRDSFRLCARSRTGEKPPSLFFSFFSNLPSKPPLLPLDTSIPNLPFYQER